jgi:hypothetical protein
LQKVNGAELELAARVHAGSALSLVDRPLPVEMNLRDRNSASTSRRDNMTFRVILEMIFGIIRRGWEKGRPGR